MTLKQLNEKTKRIKRAYDTMRRRQGEMSWITADYAEGLVGDVGDLMKCLPIKLRVYWKNNVIGTVTLIMNKSVQIHHSVVMYVLNVMENVIQ